MPRGLPPLWHIGIVVADIETAAADFERRWGVATEDLIEMSFAGATYRGEKTTLTAIYGFIRSGGSEIELIQPVSTPSPYADFLAANGGDGAHHIAYVVDAIDPYLAQLAAAGQAPEVVLDAPVTADQGGRFAYVEGVAHGPAVELVELPEGFSLPSAG